MICPRCKGCCEIERDQDVDGYWTLGFRCLNCAWRSPTKLEHAPIDRQGANYRDPFKRKWGKRKNATL